MEYKYKVLISCHRDDTELKDSVYNILKEIIDEDQIFVDRKDWNNEANEWAESLQNALRYAEHIVICISDNSFLNQTANWYYEVIEKAIQQQKAQGIQNIIPIANCNIQFDPTIFPELSNYKNINLKTNGGSFLRNRILHTTDFETDENLSENNNDRQYVVNTIFNLLYAIANKKFVDSKYEDGTQLLGKQAMEHIKIAKQVEKWYNWYGAKYHYEKALDLINQLDDNDNHKYAKALTLNNLAFAELNNDEFQSAHEHIQETIELLSQLPTDPENLRSTALYNLEIIETSQPDESTIHETIYNESLNLDEKYDDTPIRQHSSSKSPISRHSSSKSTQKDNTKTLVVILAIIILLIVIVLICC